MSMLSDLYNVEGQTAGFTGTANGMTQEQKAEVRDILLLLKSRGFKQFRHGGCMGADVQAASIAYELGYYVIEHPGYDRGNPDLIPCVTHGGFEFNDEVWPPKPFLVRDRDIVKFSDLMIAAPKSREELRRSGTWATVRYARKANKTIAMVYPSPTLPKIQNGPLPRTNAIAGEQPLYGPTYRQRGVK